MFRTRCLKKGGSQPQLQRVSKIKVCGLFVNTRVVSASAGTKHHAAQDASLCAQADNIYLGGPPLRFAPSSSYCRAMDEHEGEVALSPIPENSNSVEQSLEKVDDAVKTPSPLRTSFNVSLEDLSVTQGTTAVETTPLRQGRKLTGTPSTAASTSHHVKIRSISSAPEVLREKSPSPTSSLSSYDGSEASHAERRFLRLYEELEAHCMGIPCPCSFLG